MVTAAPFKGITYNPDIITNLSDVLAPPYDVISPTMQDQLHQLHDHNVIRLILGKTGSEDNDENNRYTRAAEYLGQWLEDGSLTRSDEPAIYLYSQEYNIGDTKSHRLGFICRVRLEPFGASIYPHERTMSGPKEDRLKLMKACETNFSQVFGLYADKELTLDTVWENVMRQPADMSATVEGIEHEVWVISNKNVINQITSFLTDVTVVIADGHHRYETALNYSQWRRERDNENRNDADYDYVMMYLSNIHSQGFTVLPTHRIVTDKCEANLEALLERLKTDFDIVERQVTPDMAGEFEKELKAAGANAPSFGMYLGNGAMSLLTMKGEVLSTLNSTLQRLDVTILQERILENALGISKEQVASKSAVCYMVDAGGAMELVDNGVAQAAFLMNNTEVDQVMDVATSCGVMPQKSTYFYPKLISGLVFNPL